MDAEIPREKLTIERDVLRKGVTKWCVETAEAFGYSGYMVSKLIDFE